MNKRIFILSLFILVINIDPVFAREYEKIKITDFRVELPPKIDHKSRQIKNLSSRLDRLYKLHAEKGEYIQFAKQCDLQLVEDRVVVTILTRPGVTTADIDENNLKAFGSRIQAKAKHSMRVEIPISELENVSTAIKELAEIIPPMKPKEHAVTSEGVALMNADEWHSVGDSGSGVKVAVIDGGFMSLTDAQTNGDIPESYVSHYFSGSGLETGTPHGTAVTEAIFDLVPQAYFYLYKIADETDFENAVDSCDSNGVDIINHSMGWFNAGGYYDGTGFICSIVDTAIDHGILWVNSAGNSAEDHYRATFSDDGYGYHDFSGTGANVNPIGPDPTHVWNHNAGEYIIITLNWDVYPYTDQDYDLHLYRYTGSNWVLAASSTDRQTGSSRPEETIVFQNNIPDGNYGIVVEEYSCTTNVDFTLFDLDRSLGYRTNSSSLTDPGTITDVVTVGAISQNNYTSGPQEYFSSQGPTNDGRTKPDVAAPDSCNSYAYGYWKGTSLSSPHTAGVCALIKSRFPGYNNSEIRNYLYTNCTVDLGTSGQDNIYGWGKVEMPDIALTVTSPNGGEDFQVDSIHNVTWISSGTSGDVRIEYSTDIGTSWSDVIAEIPDTGAFAWTIPDTPSDSCLLRIADTNGSLADTSDAIFKISPIPFITVTSPNGGEDFQVDSVHNATWTSSGTSGGVLIQYSTDSGSSWSDVITSIPDTGVYPWTIPGDTTSDNCLVRIADTNGSLADTSDAIFKISPIPFITVTSPNGGEDFQVDSVHNVTWNSSGTSGGVLIQYSTDSGSSWSDVITSIPDTGVYPWTIPGDTTSDNCLVRIADTNGSLADTSDAIFTISPISYITVITPNGGEDWGTGYSYYITWTSIGTSGGVQIKYSINNGSSWEDVIAVMPDTGVYFWTIPDTTSDSCLVIISDTTGNPADTSDAVFSFVYVTSIPTPELPEVYSFNIKGITVGNQFDIKYALPERAKFKLEVYDIKGTKIKEISEEKSAGFYSGKIDMRGKPAGVYFIRMEANGKKFTKINKVVLVK